ncbi:SDR family NAD(P)-dependent oxidoreductase [Pseudodesulfovibrio karagichevae]|uniref:SDR family NAD(P)-dependent oxidoreductase n=1 Tax=Pseudodesulfovibrio karagichevae TaxID=3239305 RepID=A0ABV4JZT0_9BACT
MRIVVISASSGIGSALCRHWRGQGHEVFGTYRTASDTVSELEAAGAAFFPLDIADAGSVDEAAGQIGKAAASWDVLVLAPGTTEPVGPFLDTDPDEWARSLDVNFVNQWRLVHRLLPTRSGDAELGPCVLFFAGGGTNNAVVNYSAYTISKVACIKMCELLDAEVSDTRFSIVGPGWVKTRIHEETLQAGAQAAGHNYEMVKSKLKSGDFVPMEKVIDSCDWVISQPREVVGGRNFSTAHDAFGSAELAEALRNESNMYKLRRHGNAWRPLKND